MGLGDRIKANRDNPKLVTTPNIWVPERDKEPRLLIAPNIPKPMHSVCPREILGRAWWDKYRKQVYASTDHHCKACGVHKYEAKGEKWLEAHEVYDIDYSKARMTFIKAVPLCNYCHMYIHDGRMNNLVQLGKMSHAKYAAVIQHGDAILAETHLRKPTLEERELMIQEKMNGNELRWEDWRLILNGIEYPPVYQSYAQWLKAMGWI